jgi:phosphatidylglycerol:prolipoprotein diacylglycerol transferase
MPVLLETPWFKLEPWPVPVPGIGELPIQPFGILVAIGVLLGAKISEKWAMKNGIAPAAVADFVAHVVILGFVLGYVLNAVFYHPDTMAEVMGDPTLLFKRYLGLSSYGGFLGAALGAVLWRFRRRLPGMPVADAVAFGFPFGWIFGRMGCFVVHDHPGAVTDFFLAVSDYEVGVPPYQPRHDLGLYEIFWSLGAIVLFVLLARKKRPTGFFAALLPLSYTPVRFFLDYLRAEPTEGGDVRYGGFTPGQYASIGLFLLGVGLMWWVYTRTPDPLPDKLKWPPPDAGTLKSPSKDKGAAPKSGGKKGEKGRAPKPG